SAIASDSKASTTAGQRSRCAVDKALQGEDVQRTGAELLIEQLIREGIDKLFGVPGVQLDWATDALRKEQSRIDFIVPKHEQTTSYMADGYSRVSGRIGACMVVPGPGLLNAMAGLSTAYACSSRVLCIS